MGKGIAGRSAVGALSLVGLVAALVSNARPAQANGWFSFHVSTGKKKQTRPPPAPAGAAPRPAATSAPAAPAPSAVAMPVGAPTPTGFARADSPAAKQPAERLSPDALAQRLPHSNVIIAENTSSDPDDTVARQLAAFDTLTEFVELYTHHDASKPHQADMAASLVARLDEYETSRGDARSQSSSGARQEGTYSANPAFRDYLIGQYVSDGTVTAYEAARNARQVQQVAAQNQANGVRAQGLVKDTAAARNAHVDLSVFGVALGEPLNLPQCPKNNQDLGALLGGMAGIGVGAERSCVGDPSMNMALGVVQFAQAMVGGSAGPSNAQIVPVSLGKSHCPSWVQTGGACSMLAAIQDGIVVGVSFTTGLDSASVQQASAALHTKYPGTPQPGESTECRNNMTGMVVSSATEKHWALPGLWVSYSPIINDCKRGKVEVQAASYHSSQQVVEAQQAQAQPQM